MTIDESKLCHIVYKISPEDSGVALDVSHQINAVVECLRSASTEEERGNWAAKYRDALTMLSQKHEELWRKYNGGPTELRGNDYTVPPRIQVYLHTDELIISYSKNNKRKWFQKALWPFRDSK